MSTRSKQDNATRHSSVPRSALSINEFCAAVGISPGTYARMKRERWGPREMRIGKKVGISQQALADWIIEREQAAMSEEQEGTSDDTTAALSSH